MDLHANAALSWSGRRELARRVVEEGWTLTAAAEAAGVSVRCARKWVGRYRAGDRQLRDRSSAPRRVANRTSADRVAVIVALRRLRMTAAEIAETLAMPLSTVSAILRRQGVGRLGRIGLEPAGRYERSRPGELVHIDVKKLGRFEAAGKRVGFRLAGAGRPAARRARPRARHPAGSTSTSPSTTTAVSPTPRYSRRKGGDRGRLPPPCTRLLRPPRRPGRAGDHRQWRRLHLDRPRDRLPQPRHPPPPHPAAPTPDQRQSRALHPHHAQRLGLRRHLPHKPRTHRRP